MEKHAITIFHWEDRICAPDACHENGGVEKDGGLETVEAVNRTRHVDKTQRVYIHFKHCSKRDFKNVLILLERALL